MLRQLVVIFFICLTLINVSGCTTTSINPTESEINFILQDTTIAPKGYRDLKSRKYIRPIKNPELLTTTVSHKHLSVIFNDVKKRFNFVEDKELYGEQDRWLTMDEIPEGDFNGDCEDFAQAIRKILLEHKILGNLVFCKVEDGSYHIVVSVGSWVLDNRSRTIKQKYDLDYKFISMMQPDGTWKRINNS